MLKWDGRGQAAEEEAAKQFNGTMVTDLEEQYKDIDLYVPSKLDDEVYSVSVKDQTYSTRKGYNTIQIELELKDTDTGDTIDGCFLKNESDYYFWKVVHNGNDVWVIVRSKVLNTYINLNKDNLTPWYTTNYTNQKNRQLGRKYNSSSGVMVSIDELIKLGDIRRVEQCMPM